ncbi:hypothetical protein ACFQZ4_12320 [Catellatospora coxensis]
MAIVRGDTATVVRETARAAAAGARLIVTTETDPALLAAALDGTGAHAVTATPTGPVLVDANGQLAHQPVLHPQDPDDLARTVADSPDSPVSSPQSTQDRRGEGRRCGWWRWLGGGW